MTVEPRAAAVKLLLCILFTAATLPKRSLCLPNNCSTVNSEGTDFSVTDLSCENYTVEFSWTLNLILADTRLELSCHNGTDGFTPDITDTTKLGESESFFIPLTGAMQCRLSGCYTDIFDFQDLLIPVTIFDCQPPPIPAVTTSYYVTTSAIIETTTIQTQDQQVLTTVYSSTLFPTPSITPTFTSTTSQVLRLQVIVSVSLSLLIVVVLITIILCKKHRQVNRFSIRSLYTGSKYHMNNNDKVDPDYEPKFQFHYYSNLTLIEPYQYHTPVTIEVVDSTPPTPIQSDGESHHLSIDSIHQAMPSLQTELAYNIIDSDCTPQSLNIEESPIIQSSDQRQANLINAHPNTGTTSTYVYEPHSSCDISQCHLQTDEGYYRKISNLMEESDHWCLELHPNINSQVTHDDDVLQIENCNNELINNNQASEPTDNSIIITSKHLKIPRDHTNELLTPQLPMINGLIREEEDDKFEEIAIGDFMEEVLTSFDEKFAEQRKQEFNSPQNTSGLSTGSYLQ